MDGDFIRNFDNPIFQYLKTGLLKAEFWEKRNLDANKAIAYFKTQIRVDSTYEIFLSLLKNKSGRGESFSMVKTLGLSLKLWCNLESDAKLNSFPELKDGISQKLKILLWSRRLQLLEQLSRLVAVSWGSKKKTSEKEPN